MNVLIKKPIIPYNRDNLEQDEPGQRILIGILSIKGQDLVADVDRQHKVDISVTKQSYT